MWYLRLIVRTDRSETGRRTGSFTEVEPAARMVLSPVCRMYLAVDESSVILLTLPLHRY